MSINKKIISKDTVKKKWFKEIENNKRDYFIYIDNPFCLDFCSFCIYDPTLIKDKKTNKIKEDYYQRILIDEIKFYGEILRQIKVKAVYFGGGTSSIMSSEEMEKVFSSLQNYFDFKNMPLEKTFEFNPILMTEDKIKLLSKWNFTNVTMGVQSFNKDVLKYNNRTNISIDKMKKLFLILKKYNFQVNMDLMVFIYKDDLLFDIKNLINDIDIALNILKPDRLTLFPNYHKIYDNERKYNKTVLKKILKLNYIKISLLRLTLSKMNYSSYITDFPSRQVTADNSKLNYYFLKKDSYKEIVYNCSGWTENTAKYLSNHNLIAIGGYGNRKPYSYIGDEYCYHNIYEKNELKYSLFYEQE